MGIDKEWIDLNGEDGKTYVVHCYPPRFIVEFEGLDGEVIAGVENIPPNDAARWARKAGEASGTES